MSGKGLQQSLQELLDDQKSWVRLGQVTKVENNSRWGWLVTLAMIPDGSLVQCRPLWWGTGDGYGAFFPISVDDEMLVLIPDSDINRGICVQGLASRPARAPDTFDNDHVEIVHPNGVIIRGSAESIARTLVQTNFLDDFTPSIIELQAPCLAFGMPVVSTKKVEQAMPGKTYRTQKLDSE
jgi:hypothetical protein